MANLQSPGVQVQVIDESFYLPAAPGTTPMIFIASGQDKLNPSGNIAQGTTAENAGKIWLITSQRDLTDTFGTPVFYTDASSNPLHGNELNEYGLQAAYSLLGVSSRAYVVRSNLDTTQLLPSSSQPTGSPVSGTYWVDTDGSLFGLKVWNSVTEKFTSVTPIVLDDNSPSTSFDGVAPAYSVGDVGDFCMVLTKDNENTLYYKVDNLTWEIVSDDFDTDSKTLTISPHYNYPTYTTATVSKSAWVVTTTPSNGANWSVKYYDGAAQEWLTITAPIYDNALAALKALDSTGGGKNISVGNLYINSDFNDTNEATFKLFRRASTGATVIESTNPFNAVLGTDYTFSLKESLLNNNSWSAGVNFTVRHPGEGVESAVVGATPPESVDTIEVIFSAPELPGGALAAGLVNKVGNTATTIVITEPGSGYLNPPTVTFTATSFIVAGDNGTSELTDTTVKLGSVVANSINASTDLVNVVAVWNSTSNKITISHKLGGEIQIYDNGNTPFDSLGFTAFDMTTSLGTANLYTSPSSETTYTLQASNWKPLVYEARATAPVTTPENGALWYNSVVDEVDIMYHNGSTWIGYKNQFPLSDPNGPIVSSATPTAQSDGTPLVKGDIWISTADLDNYGRNIYVHDGSKWIEQDVTDQSTPDGWLFADARWATSGSTLTAGSISDLLSSNYLDPDAPDPALYPKGMKLWNTRRSGFNVKKYIQGHINIDANDGINIRFTESMGLYETDRWVSQYPVAADGGPQFGRLAQRAQVVNSLKELIDSNTEIRDIDTLVFNLIATPGYPEAIQNMVGFNTDRKLTAFVVGDTPFRLEPNGTALSEWGLNVNGALDNGDKGAVSYDEYMAMWYPSGYTNDNTGNFIVVPPSHMMLRTIVNSDNKSYPWFAPAGTRRGGVDNVSSVGYITSEGEFSSVALYEGLRDVLYNAKINPIATLTGAGVVAYGQKTRARNASALDRINVARLVVYLRRQLDLLARPFLFEPNDPQTRREIKAAVESLLLELVGQRALYDFIVVCDESNNTPSRIDRNELWLDVAIEPTKAIEYIYIPLRLKNTGDIAAGL